jgi:hypothetical protein
MLREKWLVAANDDLRPGKEVPIKNEASQMIERQYQII